MEVFIPVGAPTFALVVDTQQYAGNFERELCAAITGQVGECGVGQEVADAFRQRFPSEAEVFADMVRSIPDDRGCQRPVSIYATPGLYSDGMGGVYTAGDDPEVVRARYHAAWDHWISACPDRRDNRQPEPGRYPAFHSVAVYFSAFPTTEQLDFLQEQTREFVAANQLDLSGFRRVTFRVLVEEQVLPAGPKR